MAIGETAFERRIETVGEVLVSGDADRLADLYTRDAELLPPDSGFVTGRAAVVEYWQGLGEMGIESVDLEGREVTVGEEMAYRVGEATLRDGSGAAVNEVKFVEVWRPEGGEWRIHRDVWNAMGEE